MLVGDVHEDVRRRRRGRVDDEIDLDARRMVEDVDGLGTDRTGGLGEAEDPIERHRSLGVVNTDADVSNAFDHGFTRGMRRTAETGACRADLRTSTGSACGSDPRAD